MASPEATVILGAAVIDDVMGLFVLAFLAASITSAKGEAFGFAPMASAWLQQRIAAAASHPLIVQMIDDQRLRGRIFRCRIRRGKALARSV